MNIININKAPKRVEKKASEIIKQFREGSIRPRKTIKHGYKVLEVGRRYRLIKKQSDWLLMSHAHYDRVADMG